MLDTPLQEQLKTCCTCKREKPLSEFPKNSTKKGGYAYWCRECKNRQAKTNGRNWPSRHASRHLKDRYRVTPPDYEEMLERQSGVCAICKDPPVARRLVVDHDHATGKVRGLLCWKCNLALGYLEDRAEAARAAAEYLIAHQ